MFITIPIDSSDGNNLVSLPLFISALISDTFCLVLSPSWVEHSLYTVLTQSGYTSTKVAFGWAGAVIKRLTQAFGQEQ